MFMGTPDFAVPSLQCLADNFDLVGVISQPDRPAGRGRKLESPPIKLQAELLGLEIFQPHDPNSEDSLGLVSAWKPDLICVAAYGQILRTELLNLPGFGCLNVHASLLPRWRGASPISAAILSGDPETGISIMRMDQGLDSGPILSQISTRIDDDENAGSLSERLAGLGADLLVKTIPDYVQGRIDPIPQDPDLATYAGLIKKPAGLLDFNSPAEELARKVRAYTPWPGCYCSWKSKRLLVHQVRAAGVSSPGSGVFLIHGKLPAIGTSSGVLILEEIQLAGKKPLSGEEFLRGNPGWS